MSMTTFLKNALTSLLFLAVAAMAGNVPQREFP